MPIEILMPEIGESVHEGTLSRWLKKVGDVVKEDEPIVEIMTDKVNTELPSPASGILSKIFIQEGEQVEVFKAMGLIEPAGSVAAVASEPAPAPAESVSENIVAPAPATPSDDERRWFSPLVRAMIKENGISAEAALTINGSGEGGRVSKKDVEEYLGNRGREAPTIQAPVAPQPKSSASTKAGPDQELKPLVGMRKMIAEAMVRSSLVPTVCTVTQCDVTTMVHFREREKESFQATYGVKLTYTPFFIKALTESLLEFPLVNSSLQPDNQILVNHGVHVGVAVALGAKGDEGLIVPVIPDCQKKGLVEIAKSLESIAKAARSNTLKPTDVQGGTFTLTNPGTYGALFGTPMINAPQGAILGTYAIVKMPVIVNDMIAIRSVMHLALTYDHRIIDGLLAGKFLASVRDRLQNFDFFK